VSELDTEQRTSGTTLPPGARDLLSQPVVAILSTINQDGSPHANVMSFLLRGELIMMTTKSHRRTPRNLARDPRAAFIVYDHTLVSRYVEVRGTVEIVTAGAIDFGLDVSEFYSGVRQRHKGDDDREDLRVTLQLTPTWVHYRPR
jgi:PPOX class probable F420-dependent enzyme